MTENNNDYMDKLNELKRLYDADNEIFSKLRIKLEPLMIQYNNKQTFDTTTVGKAMFLIDAILGDNMWDMIDTIWYGVERNAETGLEDFDENFCNDLIAFAKFVGAAMNNAVELDAEKHRQASVSCRALSEIISQKPLDKVLKLTAWMTKWGMYLNKEEKFSPTDYKIYKQGEIILVDFGFNIDGEFGGRHYAVVIEKNNSPKSSTVLVAPISTEHSGKISPANIDLGVGAINDYQQRTQVVMNQIRYISKLRIEKPISPAEPRKYLPKEKVQQIVNKLNSKINC